MVAFAELLVAPRLLETFAVVDLARGAMRRLC